MDILFWSGGKDSYLALEFYKREYDQNQLKLLTTYREDNDMVPHQEIALDDIRKQAENLDLNLILVPLPKDCPNDVYLKKVGEALENCEKEIENLVFGDWKLEDIREWREEEFGKMGYRCLFPIWKKSLNELMPVLMLKPVEVKINAAKDEYSKYIAVGETYDQKFVRQLPEDIDPMGENGEFHTKVTIQTFDDIEPEKQPLY
jgi:diphthamide synthase (EF-2-diphthine--ammonia ligase)